MEDLLAQEINSWEKEGGRVKKAVAGIVMGSLDHPPGVSVNLKLVRDKMDKDTFQCGKKSLNYQTNASYLQIVKELED